MERQLIWLLRRKLEHNTLQLIVEHVEHAIEAAGAAPQKAAKVPAIAFVDMSGYTALTEQIGDQAAADRAAGGPCHPRGGLRVAVRPGGDRIQGDRPRLDHGRGRPSHAVAGSPA
jgi:hypothetical protein